VKLIPSQKPLPTAPLFYISSQISGFRSTENVVLISRFFHQRKNDWSFKSDWTTWQTNRSKKRKIKKDVREFSTNESPQPFKNWIIFLMIMLFGAMSYLPLFVAGVNPGEEIDFLIFKERYLYTGRVKKLIVSTNSKRVEVVTENPNEKVFFIVPDVKSFEIELEEIQRKHGIELFDYIPISFTNKEDPIRTLLRGIQTFALIGMVVLGYILIRRQVTAMGSSSSIFSFGKGKHKRFNKETKINISFKDVAGMDEAKLEIMEFVDFLKNPTRYTKLGAKIPKGAILIGPPGTGKTLLAKATAGEAGVPFFSVSGSDFIEMFVGVGPSRVRDMFNDARENAPCIVFIDEIDAVGRERGRGAWTNDERENTLNQLLVEMDGFSSESGVVVMAGTNRPDILDPALLRPGRFDRQIYIENPDIKGRKAIFEIYLKKLKLGDPLEDCAKRLASLTPGFSGADIANVCNEGALIAARYNKSQVMLQDLESAIDRVIGGMERKNRILSAQEKLIVSYHESGHAVVGWFLEHASPLLKVSIVPRGVAALGFAQYQPKDHTLYSQEQLLDRICMTLGGRIAEELTFGRISTGASDDLDKVTKLAYAQVIKWGMNSKIGNVSYPDISEEEFAFQKPYSEATSKLIDEEVRVLVAEAYTRTRDLLVSKKEELSKVAKRLLEKEVLMKEDLVELLGKRPFPEQTTYEELIHEVPPSNQQPNPSV
jgi:AFG3 family protein